VSNPLLDTRGQRGTPGLLDRVSRGGLTQLVKGVTLWVPRGGQEARRTNGERNISQIEIPSLVAFTGEEG